MDEEEARGRKVGKIPQILPRVDLLQAVKGMPSTKDPYRQNLRWLKMAALGWRAAC